MKKISSQPDASKFRSIVVVIFVLICISLFLSYTKKLSQKAEIISKERVVSDLRYSLAMMLYDYTIQGKRQQLFRFDRENPFIPLAIYRALPVIYWGVVNEIPPDSDYGWYFEKKTGKVIYVDLNGNHSGYVMRYLKKDLDSFGRLYLEEI